MSKVNLRQSGQGWDDFDFEESVPKAAVPCSIQMSMLGFVLDSSRSSARGTLNHSQLCSQIVLGLFADFASEEFRIGVSVVFCSKSSCLSLLQAKAPKAKAAVASADSEGRKSITSCRHAPGTLAPPTRSGSLIAGILFRH